MPLPATLNVGSLGGDDGFVVRGACSNDLSGAAVGAAGDVNGDGIDDLVIGAWSATNGSNRPGAAYVVFGRSDGMPSAIEVSELDGSDGFVMFGAAPYDRAGYAVAGAGDINGDGFADVVVGEPYAANYAYYGNGYVVFGRSAPHTEPLQLSALDGGDGFVIRGPGSFVRTGMAVDGVGDFNDDGVDDFVIGAPRLGSGYEGGAYVVFGRSGAAFDAEIELASFEASAGLLVQGTSLGGFVGRAVAGAGDVNGDGIADLIVGAPNVHLNGDYSGGAYVIFGRSGISGTFSLSSLDPSQGFAIAGREESDQAGHSVDGAGDVNGDGIGDVIVGTWEGGGSTPPGRVYVVFGRTAPVEAPIQLSALSGSDGFAIRSPSQSEQTYSVSGVGDVNGDGVDDVLVGGMGFATNGVGSGGAYVVYGRTDPFPAQVALDSLGGTAGFVIAAASSHQQLGSAVGGVGDLNDDGIADLAVGAMWATPGVDRESAGATYVIFGQTGTPPPPDTTPPDAPTVDAIADDTGTPGDGVTTDRFLSVSGTAEPLSTVRVFRGATLVDDTTVDDLGNWSLADPTMLAFGPHLYRAEAEDEAGNTSARSAPLEVFVVNPAASPTGGADLVLGAAGANQIQGGAGNDTVFGEDGNDTLKGNDGNDRLDGGQGSDRLDGENGADVARGGNGDDTVYGQNGRDTISGDNGNDRLEGGSDADSIDGGGGADTMYGGAGTDTLVGGTGGDRLYGDADPDWIDLGDDTSRDTVFGTIAHLNDDTIDGFVGGTPATPGADLLLITGLTNAQAKKLDGDLLDEDGVMSLAEVGGGSIAFEGHGGATVDAIFTAGGVQIWIV